jgi:protease-4
MVLKFKEFREKYGLSFYTVTGSDRSSYLDPGKSLSDEDKALINSSIESTYATFVRKVAAGRHKTEAEIDAIAQGRVWTGQQALSNGLVDELGGMSKAFQAAKRLGGLDQERLYPIRQFKKKHMSLLECLHSPSRLAECFDQGGSILKAFGRSIATTPAAGVMEKVESLQHHVSKSPILAMWPGYFNIEHP